VILYTTYDLLTREKLLGHIVVSLRLIFRIVTPQQRLIPGGDRFLTYVQRFDIVPQLNSSISGSNNLRGTFPEPSTSLYLLKKGKRSNGIVIGDILPLDQIRCLADIVPRFGQAANRTLTKDNSIEYSTEYWLNKYFNKELFWSLSL
jgi:hypothetical protein